jgi:glutamate racemase
VQPIGVFDSGVGGLTVLRALRRTFPGDDFIYLGDTARLPYGTKSPATVTRYSLQCAELLVQRGIRCLVVACNTASASALDELRLAHPSIPVIGVIDPGAEAAVAASRSQHIAVIATEATIAGGAYQMAIRRLRGGARVTAAACSLFVAMAEEGWVDGEIPQAVARRYLDPIFRAAGDMPDTLVLGCTHFPVLAAAIGAVLPPGVRMVDSAATTAAALLKFVTPRPLAAGPGRVTWLATDDAGRFARVGSSFLGEPLLAADIEIVDLTTPLPR